MAETMTRLLAFHWPWWLAWLGWLLDTSMGPPGPRGHFPAWLTLAFHGSNALMGAAFMAAPLIAMRGYRHRREGVPTGVIVAGNVLCAAMAASRFARVLEMYGPPYRLTTLLDVIAAVALTYCVVKLYPALSTILKLPSRKELHDANDKLGAEVIKSAVREAELAESNRVLVGELAALRFRLGDKLWYHDRDAILTDIERITALIPRPESPRRITDGP